MVIIELAVSISHLAQDGEGLTQMANYVAWHNKKRARRLLCEEKLAMNVQRGAPRERQLYLAEDIRLARIRQLRSDRALVVPTLPDAAARLQQFDAKIAELEQTTPEQILKEFLKE